MIRVFPLTLFLAIFTLLHADVLPWDHRGVFSQKIFGKYAGLSGI
jgi:hypothetical protein